MPPPPSPPPPISEAGLSDVLGHFYSHAAGERQASWLQKYLGIRRKLDAAALGGLHALVGYDDITSTWTYLMLQVLTLGLHNFGCSRLARG